MTKKALWGIFSLFTLLVLLPAAQKDAVAGRWSAQPVELDGRGDDWPADTFRLDKKTKVHYAFANDGDHLYVAFTFTDMKTVSTLAQSGITLWINTQGKNKKEYGIHFLRTRVPAATFIQVMEQRQGPMPADRKAELMKKQVIEVNQIRAVNKKGEPLKEAVASEEKSCGFMWQPAQTSWTLEFRVPLERIENTLAGVGAQPGDTVAIAFEWGGITAEMRARMSAGETGAVAQRAGDLTEERDWEGMERGGDRDPRRGPPRYSFWTLLQLATN